MTDSKELMAELRGRVWMVNCEMRGLIPDDTAERAAAHIAALEGRLDALEGALRKITTDPYDVRHARAIAKAALGGEQHGG